jgi:hypothetical protein
MHDVQFYLTFKQVTHGDIQPEHINILLIWVLLILLLVIVGA